MYSHIGLWLKHILNTFLSMFLPTELTKRIWKWIPFRMKSTFKSECKRSVNRDGQESRTSAPPSCEHQLRYISVCWALHPTDCPLGMAPCLLLGLQLEALLGSWASAGTASAEERGFSQGLISCPGGATNHQPPNTNSRQPLGHLRPKAVIGSAQIPGLPLANSVSFSSFL